MEMEWTPCSKRARKRNDDCNGVWDHWQDVLHIVRCWWSSSSSWRHALSSLISLSVCHLESGVPTFTFLLPTFTFLLLTCSFFIMILKAFVIIWLHIIETTAHAFLPLNTKQKERLLPTSFHSFHLSLFIHTYQQGMYIVCRKSQSTVKVAQRRYYFHRRWSPTTDDPYKSPIRHKGSIWQC